MANISPSGKRVQISKANSLIVISVAVSSFLVVFSLVACRALLSQRAYQSRVIAKKEAARDQLKKNLDAATPLINAYKTFVGTTSNVLGGNPSGTSDKDGDNAKIILDALPSKYDFPALATSLEKLLDQNGIKIDGITGTDLEITQGSQQTSPTPQPVEIPFEINFEGNYGNIQKLISIFEHSIRPFYIDSINYSGTDKDLTLDLKAKTYYQPEKDLTIRTEIVK